MNPYGRGVLFRPATSAEADPDQATRVTPLHVTHISPVPWTYGDVAPNVLNPALGRDFGFPQEMRPILPLPYLARVYYGGPGGPWEGDNRGGSWNVPGPSVAPSLAVYVCPPFPEV